MSDQKKKPVTSAKPRADINVTEAASLGAHALSPRVTEIGRRYSRSVFELAVEGDVLDQVSSDLSHLNTWVLESADLAHLFLSPVIDPAHKAKALDTIAEKAGFQLVTRKFLGVLARNGRLPLYASIYTSFVEMMDGHNKTARAHVVTSVPLSAAQAKSLSTALTSVLGAVPNITSEVDPSLLGGIKVKVGSRLFDASLKTKLDSLKFALKRA